MNRKIKLAVVANSLDVNGISTVILNYCCNMSKELFDISIIAGSPIAEENRNKAENSGVKVIELPSRKKSSKLFYKSLYSSLKKGKYDMFHVHGNSATITIELFLAWICGIKTRIAHSHNTTCDNQKIHKLLYPAFSMLCTDRFACGKAAGRWLFRDKDFSVIPNGFITEKFVFDKDARRKIRQELNIEDKYVIGHMGRFNNQKNHPFLLEIFKQIAASNENAVLLLIGDGPDFDKVMELINAHPYKDRIIVYGTSNSPQLMYSVMDLFLFPSKYEGLPVVLLEAQICGLPCVISDVITDEVVLTDNVKMVSLNDSTAKWADAVDEFYRKNNTDSRSEFYSSNRDVISLYDIEKNVKDAESLYIKIDKRKK